jgi:FlaA1/EpsC-like NDP-sugar epimerase
MNRMMFSQEDAAKLIRKTIEFTHWTGGGFVMTKLMKNVNMGALARMISDNVEIVGSRPGEKINEDLISASELPFTTLVEDEYVMIGNTVSSDDRRLTQPVNSETAKQMSDSELRQLVYGSCKQLILKASSARFSSTPRARFRTLIWRRSARFIQGKDTCRYIARRTCGDKGFVCVKNSKMQVSPR